MRTLGLLLTTLAFTTALAACSDDPVKPDAGDMDGGTGADGSVNNTDGGDVTTTCPNEAIPASASGACSLTAGGASTLIRGNLVVPEGRLDNGHLLIAADGHIACAACDCSGEPEFAGATVIACKDGLVSPALVNAHDHITFTETAPTPPSNPEERYDHRHQWRRGQDGHERIASVSNRGGNNGVWWGELRHLMGGATAINGSGGAAGLLRNVDKTGALQEGLEQANVYYSTFPLGDSGGERLTTGCAYPSLDRATDPEVANSIAYTPHISEGIDVSAHNEWLCLAPSGGMGVVDAHTSVIHGIGLFAADFEQMASAGASLIWSPRSNIDLYGNTAQVALAANTGVRIALGTDWTASGSMNLLRELRCADELNGRNFGNYFSDRALVDMVTVNAATALGSDDKLGALKRGNLADVSIFNGATHGGYRALLDAGASDVVLVLRGGKAMYGDASLMSGLPDTASGCETVDVCGVMKSVCAQRDTGSTLATIKAAIPAGSYDLFFCDTPPMEPTCVPYRNGEYMGMPDAMDQDGDGIIDAMDNCPNVFNPVRPMDVDQLQANADSDDQGDACDVCPTQAGATTCAPPDPNDIDHDGVANSADNCRDLANPQQENRDQDQYGDACDLCPDQSNLNGANCTASVYGVKQKTVPLRSAVRITNLLVTGIAPNGFYAQTVAGDASYDATLHEKFSGIFVFTSAAGMKPARGDRIDIDGASTEFFGQVQLTSATFTVLSSGNAMPDPIVVTPGQVTTGGERAAELEAVLVEVRAVTVSDIAPAPDASDTAPTNEFVVDGSLRVNDQMYLVNPFPVMSQPIMYLRGLLRFGNNNSKLEPRDVADVGVPEALVAIAPSPVFVPLGTNGVPPGGLAVTITRPASANLMVTLQSSDAAVTVPASVTVLAGQTQVDIPVNAVSEPTGPVTLTASYDGRMVTGTLRVYSDATVRRVESVSLGNAIVSINSSASGLVTIDVPAAAAGTNVNLAVTPAGLASVPVSVSVPAGQVSMSFQLTTTASTGPGQVTASIGAQSVSFAFQVTASVRRPPMPGDLMITELHVNPSASSEKLQEWFEVYNPTGDEIEIDGLSVADNGGMAALGAAGVFVAPGGYAVIAYSADPAMNGGVTAAAEYGAADLQLANGNDIITISYGGMTVDVVDWATGWPGLGQGESACLKFPYAGDNNVPASWGSSVGTFGTVTDRGSPGVASSSVNCP